MVAAATLFIAILAASSQAIASHNPHQGRSLHDASHHHLAGVVRDYVAPSVSGPLAKRHESNKKRTNTVKRARRCKPKPKSPLANAAPVPTPSKNNTPVKDKGDDGKEPPNPPPKKADPPKADPPKADPPKKDDPKPTPPPPKGGDSRTFTGGDGTFYDPGLNACGTVDPKDSFIAAVSHEFFDTFPGATANPNNNPICGRKVRATYEGKSVVVAISDRCGGCELKNSLDFSPKAFEKLADPSIGRIHDIEWEFI